MSLSELSTNRFASRPGETDEQHFRRLFIEEPAQERREMSPYFFELNLTSDQISYLRAYVHPEGKMWGINWHERAVTFSKTKKKNVLYSLFGVVGIGVRVTEKAGREWYRGYFIPEQNREALLAANITGGVQMSDEPEYGPFIKPLEAQDIPVLRTVWERDAELREQFKGRIIPSFHSTEVAKLAGIERQDAKDSLDRLCGLLGKKYLARKRGHVRMKWFVPAARRGDIQAFLAAHPQ